MSLSVTIDGSCGVTPEAIRRALLDSDLGCGPEPSVVGVLRVRYEGFLIEILPPSGNGFLVQWNGFDPLAGLAVDAPLRIDLPRGGDALVRDATIARLTAWLIRHLPGTWVQGYDIGRIDLVHARGETVLFRPKNWRRGDDGAVLNAMPLRHRWGASARGEILTWDPSGERPDYARLAALVRSAREADATVATPRGALTADILETDRTLRDLGVPLPEDYAVLLSLTDGLERGGAGGGGVRLHATGESEGSLTLETLRWRERAGERDPSLNDALVLGVANGHLLCVDAAGRATTRDLKGTAVPHPSVLLMLEEALDAR